MKEVEKDQSVNECPNCWGYQEYENERVEPIKNQINPIGWINTYVKEHLS